MSCTMVCLLPPSCCPSVVPVHSSLGMSRSIEREGSRACAARVTRAAAGHGRQLPPGRAGARTSLSVRGPTDGDPQEGRAGGAGWGVTWRVARPQRVAVAQVVFRFRDVQRLAWLARTLCTVRPVHAWDWERPDQPSAMVHADGDSVTYISCVMATSTCCQACHVSFRIMHCTVYHHLHCRPLSVTGVLQPASQL